MTFSTPSSRVLELTCSPALPAGKRLTVLDEIKGLAILLVIIYHGAGAAGASNVIHGEIGVDIFLLVSGLTLALNSAELSAGQFFARRFFRIFPSYWLALGLFVWTGAHFYGAHKSWPNLILHFTGLHGFGPPEFFTDINQSFWFISLIVAAYIVFFILRKHLDDLSLLVGVCGGLTTVACVYYQEVGHIGGLIHLAIRIPSFFVGLIAGRLLGAGQMSLRLNFNLGLGVACFYYLIFFRNITFAYTLAAVGFILTWTAWHRAIGETRLGRIVLAPFAFLGIISYELYLFHQPLLRDYSLNVMIRSWPVTTPTKVQIYVIMIAALLATILFSFGLHRLSECAFRRVRRKASPPSNLTAIRPTA